MRRRFRPGAVRALLAQGCSPSTKWRSWSKRTAFKMVARVGSWWPIWPQALGVPAGIIDLSLAPTPAVGDSVVTILEEMGLETCGCCGTTACLALLNNDAVKRRAA